MPDIPSLHIGDPCEYDETLLQVAKIVKDFAPAHDLWPVIEAMALLRALFDGKLPGYQSLQTPYHNRCHTLEVFLCAARVLDGMSRAGRGLGGAALDAALIGALLHDTGYVKQADESAGTGAQYTLQHVQRGVDFARQHCNFLAAETRDMVGNAILATNHAIDPNQLAFTSDAGRQAALVVATADMVGQMASREYLERLLFLYFEFKEAGIGGFADHHALLEKTADFYRVTRQRLDQQLDGLADMLALHFARAGGDGHNYYMESIARNIAYLDQILEADRDDRLRLLKRGGIVDQALKMANV